MIKTIVTMLSSQLSGIQSITPMTSNSDPWIGIVLAPNDTQLQNTGMADVSQNKGQSEKVRGGQNMKV